MKLMTNWLFQWHWPITKSSGRGSFSTTEQGGHSKEAYLTTYWNTTCRSPGNSGHCVVYGGIRRTNEHENKKQKKKKKKENSWRRAKKIVTRSQCIQQELVSSIRSELRRVRSVNTMCKVSLTEDEEKLGQAWWYMPVILAIERLKQEDCWVQGQCGLHRELKASQNYIARLCL